MSVEENKKAYEKANKELWMNWNLDALQDFFQFPIAMDMGKSETYTLEQVKERLQSMRQKQQQEGSKLVKVEHHAMIGEGDLLAVWQTNFYADGSSQEMMTLHKYVDGKVAARKWFPAP